MRIYAILDFSELLLSPVSFIIHSTWIYRCPTMEELWSTALENLFSFDIVIFCMLFRKILQFCELLEMLNNEKLSKGSQY